MEEESRRSQHEQHRPLERSVEVGCIGERSVDDERPHVIAEWPTECPSGEGRGKLPELVGPIGTVALRVGQVLDVVERVVGHLNAGRGGRGKPFRRHARAPLVADRLVVGGKGCLEDEHLGAVVRDQAPLGHRLEHAVGRPPKQLHRGMGGMLVLLVVDALVGLREFELEWIAAATEEQDVRFVFGVVPRLHVGIDEWRLVPGRVEGELRGVRRTDHDLVDTRLRWHDRTSPADREAVGLKPFRVGALEAEIKIDLWVDLLVDEARLAVEVASVEILGPQAAAAVDARAAIAEAGDQVGGGVLVLPDGEPGEFHPGRPVAIAGHGRIEAAVDVFGHLPGRVTGDLRRIVLRHRLVDVGGELVDRAVADERFGHVLGAGAGIAMAADAVLTVDGQARVVFGGQRRRGQTEACEPSGTAEGGPKCLSDTGHGDQQPGGQTGGHLSQDIILHRLDYRRKRELDCRGVPFSHTTAKWR